MEKIYIVTLGSFCGIEKTDFGYRYEIDDKKLRTTKCIKDNNDMIDIYDFNSYYLLKREKNGTLSQEEYKNIKLNETYAIGSYIYEPIHQKRSTILKIHLEAIKARCHINKEQKQLKKTK